MPSQRILSQHYGLCRVTVRALSCDSKRSQVQLPAVPLPGSDLGQVVHTRVSCHQAVPVTGQRCSWLGR